MTDAWPPLVFAGLGAFHGLNPAMGWLFAVALGLHRQSRSTVMVSLVPIALGHAASIAIVAALLVTVGTIVPYDLPQAWAAKLRESRCDGLVYWLRHDPSRAEGWALFGPRGERKYWKRGRELPISGEIVRRLRRECGIEVVRIPTSGELTILED